MSFDDRIEAARKFEDALIENLRGIGFSVAKNGTEHTHHGFVGQLYRSTDQTSLAIRFQPDAVACIGNVPRTFYIEAKDAKNLEKTAHEQYVKLQSVGNVVAVVFGKLNWMWGFIEDIELIDGHKTVEPYPEERRFPVDDEGWIYPRKSDHWNNGTGASNPQASGTPYREVDSCSLKEFSIFRNTVLQRLGK